MALTKVLITVTTYPLRSRSYDELVCTGGFLESGQWIRIYPVPFKFLAFKKYQWVELNLRKPTKFDFRPESYSPVCPDLSDKKILGEISTKYEWEERKAICLKEVFYKMSDLINLSKEPTNKSLATFKPTRILDLIIEDDDIEWKREWLEQLKQIDLFTSPNNENLVPRIPIKKVPYKFKYHFVDAEGKESKMMIEDWEIGALYWNCLKAADGDSNIALQKVKEKYFYDLALTKDIYLFLGTTAEWHRRRSLNPFVIIGVFYPKFKVADPQLRLF
jgi:hypothetical protein